MLRFTLRDVFWLMLLAGLVLTWWREGINLDSEKRRLENDIRYATAARDAAVKKLRESDSYFVAHGWHTVADPDDHEIGIDHETIYGGQSSARLKATSARYAEANLIQSVRAGEFGGKSVRLSAYVKTENANSTVLFVRLWSPRWSGEDQSALNYGPDKKIQPTADWKKYDLVFDVPSNEYELSFGVTVGDGITWIDDITLEAIGPAAPSKVHLAQETTRCRGRDCRKILLSPANRSISISKTSSAQSHPRRPRPIFPRLFASLLCFMAYFPSSLRSLPPLRLCVLNGKTSAPRKRSF
jgi:hypothetical protein